MKVYVEEDYQKDLPVDVTRTIFVILAFMFMVGFLVYSY